MNQIQNIKTFQLQIRSKSRLILTTVQIHQLELSNVHHLHGIISTNILKRITFK